VFNVFLGMLALLGCTLVIIFSVVYREDKTIHPLYRSLATLPDADSESGDLTITSRARSETVITEPREYKSMIEAVAR
jgi:hypothetical protein